jgi:putative flippase GtrA
MSLEGSSSARSSPTSITWGNLVRFGGLAGMGWIGDFCLLLLLVGVAGLQSAPANAISSATAALAVFLLSRELLFFKADGQLLLRCALYLSYTAVVILLASIAMRYLTAGLGAWARSADLALPVTASAAIAKILVTPPQFLLNYCTSRWLSEWRI